MSKLHTHSPEFKARVSMEPMSGSRTIQMIAADLSVNPIHVSQWKQRMRNGASKRFTSGKKSRAEEEG
jgi:transposase-like protein